MKTITSILFVIVLVVLVAPGMAAASVYYVPDNYATMQAAIDAGVSGDTIIVRDGIYKGAGNKDIDFKGKALTLRSENGPAGCIIDCEASGRGFYFHSGETSASVLDGFTVINGFATEVSPDDNSGGAVKCVGNSSPTIENCAFSGNSAYRGGAIACWFSSPSITYCYLSDNSADLDGGAIYCAQSLADVADCVFYSNSAQYGGGIHLTNYSYPTITNCIVSSNESDLDGGGIYCWYSSPAVANCTIAGNSALDEGGGTACYFSSPVVTDCILWDDSSAHGAEIALVYISQLTISYSDVEGGSSSVYSQPGSVLNWGSGNINSNPLFAAGALGTYYLSQTAAGQNANSPCMNAGSDTAVNVGMDSYTTRTDGVGDTGVVDMGYHYGLFVPSGLTQINLLSPANQSVLSSAPTFTWTADGGASSVYAVDLSYSANFSSYWSTYNNMHQLIDQTSWTMPASIWNKIPHGKLVYWKVRGADLDHTPLEVIYSVEVRSFNKQ
ncbi:right-handed parallel beta-helix repeat-containing protein [Candidatus Poribacteria bacterium]|nr:right-handed parallel beta-helix repeat-containing protein [Candidatus Poribacteria bacterium]